MFGNTITKVQYMESVKVDIRFQHNEAVNLIEMTNSLIALNNLAVEHIGKEHGIKDTKILLQGVKEGSDIYKLVVDFGVAALPMIEGVTSVKDFLEYLRSYYTIDKKSISEIKENKHYNSINADRISNFIAPVEENNTDSSMSIVINGDNNNLFMIRSEDIPMLKENIKTVKSITSQQDEVKEDENKFEKVLIEMHKATKTSKQVRDSAYCDDILKRKSVATIIVNEEDKAKVIEDPFNNYFLVDIIVNRVDGTPKLYTVTKVHEIIPID